MEGRASLPSSALTVSTQRENGSFQAFPAPSLFSPRTGGMSELVDQRVQCTGFVSVKISITLEQLVPVTQGAH